METQWEAYTQKRIGELADRLEDTVCQIEQALGLLHQPEILCLSLEERRNHIIAAIMQLKGHKNAYKVLAEKRLQALQQVQAGSAQAGGKEQEQEA